jgi:hypothetical protein
MFSGVALLYSGSPGEASDIVLLPDLGFGGTAAACKQRDLDLASVEGRGKIAEPLDNGSYG